MTIKKAIILHSGGLDSSVCLLLARHQGLDIISLGIDYGQRHSIEMQFASKLCEKEAITRKVISVRWDKPDRKLPEGRTVDEMRQTISPAFLPGRNAIFLMLAAAEASGLGATEIWIGINSLDYSGYPDCTPQFIASFQSMLFQAIPNGPKIIAPLQDLTKPQIAKLAGLLGLRKDDTWSCYKPNNIVGSQAQPCDTCDACVLSEYAWSNAEKAILPESIKL